jgi:hypothetical protein
MAQWELFLWGAAAFIAVTTLVKLMQNKRQEVTQELFAQAEAEAHERERQEAEAERIRKQNRKKQ